MLNFHSGQRRIFPSLLEWLHFLGFILYPGAWHSKHNKCLPRDQPDLFSMLYHTLSCSLCPWLLGLIDFGGQDPVTTNSNFVLKSSDFDDGFNNEQCQCLKTGGRLKQHHWLENALIQTQFVWSLEMQMMKWTSWWSKVNNKLIWAAVFDVQWVWWWSSERKLRKNKVKRIRHRNQLLHNTPKRTWWVSIKRKNTWSYIMCDQ